jgi:hypothetical protein
MQYNQPYGVSDPNAPYINGNPATGQAGSIPPAASIEYPQRELVNLITAAGLTPNNSDLTQVKEAVQIADVFNYFKYSINSGTASQWSATVPALPTMPPPKGTALWFMPGFASPVGGVVFSVNGSAFKPVLFGDLSAVTVGDVLPSAWLLLFFDGTEWLIIAGSTRRFGALPILQKNADWYVNGSTGNDSTYDGTSATVVSSTVGPFATLQRADNEVVKYNMNGYSQYVHVANGTYVQSVSLLPTNGVGTVFFVGNPSSPQSCMLQTTAANACAVLQQGGGYDFEGFRFSTGSGCLDGFASNGGRTLIRNCHFGSCSRYHMSTGIAGASMMLDGGTITIEPGANCVGHVSGSLLGMITSNQYNRPNLVIQGAVSVADAFIVATELGISQVFWNSITGAANVTGSKYHATMNGIIDSFGYGPSSIPGSTTGTLATGGQVI